MKYVFVTAFVIVLVLLSTTVGALVYATTLVHSSEDASFGELKEAFKNYEKIDQKTGKPEIDPDTGEPKRLYDYPSLAATSAYVDTSIEYGGDDATCIYAANVDTATVFTAGLKLTKGTACTPNALLKAVKLNFGSPCLREGQEFTFYLADQTCETKCKILAGINGIYAEVKEGGCGKSNDLIDFVLKSPNAVKLVEDFNLAKINFYEKCDFGNGWFCDIGTTEQHNLGKELLNQKTTKTALETAVIPKLVKFELKFDHTEIGTPAIGGNPVRLDFFILQDKSVPGVRTLSLVRSRSDNQLPLSFYTSRTKAPEQYATAEQQAALFASEMLNSECYLLKGATNKNERTTICKISYQDTCYREGGSVTAEVKEIGKPKKCLRLYSTEKGEVIIAAYLQTIREYEDPKDFYNKKTGEWEKRFKPKEIDFELAKLTTIAGVFPSTLVSETTKLTKKTL